MPGVLRTSPATPSEAPVAVIDIGSNSVRLVVYENGGRAPLPIFNEKVLCGLGRGLDRTGRMSEDGIGMALESLRRFARLCPQMGVLEVQAVATAAVREASNGPQFLETVRNECGLDVRLLTGEREAEVSAGGVLSAIPLASGVVADLGGASLELTLLDDGSVAERISLPLGTVRGNGGESIGESREAIQGQLEGLDWLPQAHGQSLYLVGGSWRALARIHMDESGYPLHVIHHYALEARDASEFCAMLAGWPRPRLESAKGLRADRLESLPFAAVALECLVKRSGAGQIVFSANGLREGCLYEALTPLEQQIDPLLSLCESAARRMGRGGSGGDLLAGWIAPALEGLVPDKLRQAACHLSDIGWSEHPDYRAEQVFLRILRMPLTGADHRERIMLGLAVASRHAALRGTLKRLGLSGLISKGERRQATAIGLAMRLAYTISGGAVSVLEQFRLERTKKKLVLTGPEDAHILVGNTVQRRLRALAAHLSLDHALRLNP
ncbi:MAG: Ppx/GppA family phosphatase [Gammaproteobacteria bacterium]|nr:Ppx/GppA family phosphatase [Gammaproteobacteria bacterium]MYL00295.1 Ppx/GppA family phosphatase [Gammaproteobacteria bacterium]